jgi:hypothetical protein
VVLDTADWAEVLAAQDVCQQFNKSGIEDFGYGKGYALVNNEFHRVLTKLAHLPCGLILISHAQEIEVETRTGKFTKTVPTLPEKARKIVLGLVDIILYCDVEVTRDANGQATVRRVLRTKPTQYYEAGDRTGRLPEILDMDYRAFVAAFNAVTAPAPVPQPSAPAQKNPAPASTPNAKTSPSETNGK